MSEKNKDIPAEELKRISIQAAKEYPLWQEHTYDNRGYSGYCRGAKAEYLRHLSDKPITAQPNHAALAIQWDATGRTWKVLEDAGISIEPGPMGDKTFSLIKENGDKEQVLPGDWIIKDQAGQFHCLKSLPSSKPEIGLSFIKASERMPKRDGDYNGRYAFNRCVAEIRNGKVYEIRGLVDVLSYPQIVIEYLEWLEEPESIPSSEPAQKDDNGFKQGYACALTCIIKSHGCDTPVEEAYKAGLPPLKKLKGIIDDYDYEILSKYFK